MSGKSFSPMMTITIKAILIIICCASLVSTVAAASQEQEILNQRITRHFQFKYISLISPCGNAVSCCPVIEPAIPTPLSLLRKTLSRYGELDSDPRTDQIIVTDLPDNIAAIETLIATIDQPFPYRLKDRLLNNETELQQYLSDLTNLTDDCPGAKVAVLRHYARFNYQAAKQIAWAELNRPNGWLHCWELTFLQPADLPAVVELFRKNLDQESYWWHLDFLAKFGTKALLPDLIALYQNHKVDWDCPITGLALQTILSLDQETGLSLLADALAYRGIQNQCDGQLLYNVLSLNLDPMMLPFLEQYLTDSDPALLESATRLFEEIHELPQK